MAINPLPPQAYTKETLLRAYSWLQNQNESIKSLAINPDVLVSLYLKAKMNGEESLERPSIQNFKAELKSLAGFMGEFDIAGKAIVENVSVSSREISGLDSRSQTMIREVRNEYNLSCDQEALRFLVALGYKKIKNLN